MFNVLNSVMDIQKPTVCKKKKPRKSQDDSMNSLLQVIIMDAALSQEIMNASSFKSTFNFAGCSSVTINYNIS